MVSGAPAAVHGSLHLSVLVSLLLSAGAVSEAMAQAAPAEAASAPAAQADELRFDIMEYEVEGNTVLSAMAIEAAVTPFLGPKRLLADVEAARVALEKAYQGAGFLTVFVDVPEQRVDSGTVRLKVLEGRVQRLSVTGSRYFSQGYIRSKVPEFSEGQVPNFNQGQRQLALVNRSESRRVQPVLKAGVLPGAVEVELKVSDELPVSASLELNNDHAAFTDPWRLNALLRYENLFQRDHSVTLNAITAPTQPSQSTVLVANYAVPLDSGNTVVGYGVYSDSTVETLGSTTVLGKGTTLGLRYVVPFGASESSTHSLTWGVDYKSVDQRLAFGDQSISTPLRYLPFQLGYGGNWSADGRQTQLNATFVAAFRRILQREVDDCPRADGSVGPEDQFACKGAGGDGGFSSLRLDLRHTHALWGGSLGLRLTSLLSFQPLPSSEQFAIGGADTVRGYLEGEASGDRGLLGSLEWRSPNFAPRWWKPDAPGGPLLTDLSVLGFVDVARAETVASTSVASSRTSLLGTGVGLRLVRRKSLDAGIDVAWPQKATAQSPDKRPRAHARVKLSF
ncbi:MAG: hypothetical protein RLZZ618_3101 [Pseudomonadota bacterium]